MPFFLLPVIDNEPNKIVDRFMSHFEIVKLSNQNINKLKCRFLINITKQNDML